MKGAIFFICWMTLFLDVANVSAEPLTKEQGEAILKELRAIKLRLEKLEQAQKQTNERLVNSKGSSRKRPTKAKVRAISEYALGQENALITLVEFTDYQCPYCKRFHDNVFPQLKKQYIDTGKLRYVSRDLPLKIHKQARSAALANKCAGEQGKFWEYRKLLFKNAKKLSKETMIEFADNVAIDKDKFRSCFSSNKYFDQIQQDIREAKAAKFTGTPSFVIGKTGKDGFVDGTTIIGARPLPYFEDLINRLYR